MVTIRWAIAQSIDQINDQEVILSGHSFGASRNIADPDAKIAVWIKFGSAKDLDRPSNSEAFFFNNQYYYRQTGNGDRGAMRLSKGRLITPVSRVTNPDHIATIEQAMKNVIIK